ncbi:hypothetical protein BDV26DRAFT_276218 [Aspergillus bertholletiae]|uniref:Uncharacterized protein n=1 Tax=Aspergillus bertholletiae TaxID=1226010 RepID=A0A5N7ARI5_9EURO|nr:hypothetical protein BDV26DRAFT_276218 [Aspergillus bertholletiae]
MEPSSIFHTNSSSSGSAWSTSWPVRYLPNVTSAGGVLRPECSIFYGASAPIFLISELGHSL